MPNSDFTVLIIDDDPLHLKLYTWILQGKGYKCVTALVKSTSVDLPGVAPNVVLLDYRLSSSLTSVDVARQVKLAFGAVPIIVLSELQWMPEEIRDHATDFVNKGEPQKLVERLAAVLQSSKSNDDDKKDPDRISASKP